MSKAKEEYEKYNETKHNHQNKSCWICEKYIKELQQHNKELEEQNKTMFEKLSTIHRALE